MAHKGPRWCKGASQAADLFLPLVSTVPATWSGCRRGPHPQPGCSVRGPLSPAPLCIFQSQEQRARTGMKYSFTLEVLTPNHPVALTPSTRPTSPLQKRRVTLRSSAVSSSQQTSSRIRRDVGPGRMTTLPSPPCGSGGSRVPGMSFCGTAGNARVPPSPASYLCTGGQRVAWGHGPRHGQEPKRPGCLLTSCSRRPGPRHPPPAPRHPPLALSRTRGGQYFTPRTW